MIFLKKYLDLKQGTKTGNPFLHMNFIDISQLQAQLNSTDQSFFLIDTRETEEFIKGHLPGAILIPWHMIDEKIGGIKKDKSIILYCRTNNRAARAAGTLETLGYTNVSVYKGGWDEWDRHFSQI